MREAFRGFRPVTPHVEFHDRMVLQLGGRTLELMQLNNIHSDADTAIWLPKERVLLSGGKERLDSNIEAAFRVTKK